MDSLNLQGQVRDAANKVALLDGELAFTKTLISFFERIDKLRKVLASIERSILNDQIVELTDTLVQASTELDDIRAQHDTCVAEVLKARLNSLREEVERSLLFHWNTLLRVEVSSSSVSAQQAIQRMLNIVCIEFVLTIVRQRCYHFGCSFKGIEHAWVAWECYFNLLH